jgi:hypothetical protein
MVQARSTQVDKDLAGQHPQVQPRSASSDATASASGRPQRPWAESLPRQPSLSQPVAHPTPPFAKSQTIPKLPPPSLRSQDIPKQPAPLLRSQAGVKPPPPLHRSQCNSKPAQCLPPPPLPPPPFVPTPPPSAMGTESELT